MKNKTIAILGVVLSMSVASGCTNFLEQPEGSLITIDSIFNSPDKAMLALYQVYGTCKIDGFPTGSGAGGTSDAACVNGLVACICDEGDQTNTYASTYKYKAGTWGPSSQDEFNYGNKVLGMRNACIFIENADKVPHVSTGKYVWNETLKQQTVAEAKYLLASMHYESMIRFGGIPIIDRVPRVQILSVNGVNKAVVTPSGYRQSLSRVAEFILRMCEEAIEYLPDAYPAGELGRANKGAALALKASTLLWMASPTYNTNIPKLSYGDARDSLICLMKTDANLWKKAADANYNVITWAEGNGYELLDDAAIGKTESYNYATGQVFDSRNKEVILFDHSHAAYRDAANFNSQLSPIYWTYAGQTHSVPMNFVRFFRDRDGHDLVIPQGGSFVDLKNLLAKAEPRFHAIAWAPGFQFTKQTALDANGGRDTAKFMYQKEKESVFIQAGPGKSAGPARGFYNKKFTNFGGSTAHVYWPIYRLAEFYLNYAEALNEYQPTHTDIVTYLNKIRLRGGLPALEEGDATYDSCFGKKDAMRSYIQRERAIELYAEEHRPFDLRRWGIAEDYMGGDYYALYLYQNGTGNYVNPSSSMSAAQRIANDNTLSYYQTKFENRIWRPEMYFYPFPQVEVNKGFLEQNPGWN